MRVQEGPKEGEDDQPPRVLIAGTLPERCLTTRKDPESSNMGQAGRLARDKRSHKKLMSWLRKLARQGRKEK